MNKEMNYRLSILMPSIMQRHKLRCRLLDILNPQLRKGVELLIDIDNREIPVGIKMQGMCEKAKGQYIVQVDDDDLVNPNYVDLILNAIETEPDVVGMVMNHYINRKYTGKTIRSIKYKEWGAVKDPDNPQYHLSHTPPHTLNPMKKELALKVKRCDMLKGSDKAYSLDLVPFLEGKTEVFIKEPIYYYYLEINKKGQRINGW